MTNSAEEGANQAALRHVVPITRLERVEPDVECVALLFWRKGFDPERAWRVAVSGDTAARMAGTHFEDEFDATAELLTRAAAYGWWPKRGPHGDYIAVPLEEWVSEGHPFTSKVPDAEAMLSRWGIEPVVVDAVANDHPPAPRDSQRHHI